MEMKDKIAARRQELADLARQADAHGKALVKAEKAADKARKSEALDAIAAELSTPELQVQSDGARLTLPIPELELFDPTEMKLSALNDLLDREARKEWTAGENWQVIGSTSAGIALLYIPFLGIPLIVFGIWYSSRVTKRHRAAIMERYPALFDSLAT
jgi:hypothetical protein